MHRIMVAGIGTGVGKTIVSGILTTLLRGDYWKPIQCGEEKKSDTTLMRSWLSQKDHKVHEPAYSFQAPLSPHHAAHLEKKMISCDSITLPSTERSLIIEGVGGVLVPLTLQKNTLDLFASWECQWVIVSQHYLGSINHTLLTTTILQQRNLSILGLVFNGTPNPQSESAILEATRLPLLGRLLPETFITSAIIQRYANEWQLPL